MARGGAGKPENFSPEIERALRAALLEFLEPLPKKEKTQAAVGARLGVTQQTAGRYMRQEDAGFSWPAATRIARLAKYAGLDDFLAAKGLRLDEEGLVAGPWLERDTAARLALGRGYSQSAIDDVIRRFSGSGYQNRPVHWWDKWFKVVWEEETEYGAAAARDAANSAAGKAIRDAAERRAPSKPSPSAAPGARTKKAKAG